MKVSVDTIENVAGKSHHSGTTQKGRERMLPVKPKHHWTKKEPYPYLPARQGLTWHKPIILITKLMARVSHSCQAHVIQ